VIKITILFQNRRPVCRARERRDNAAWSQARAVCHCRGVHYKTSRRRTARFIPGHSAVHAPFI